MNTKDGEEHPLYFTETLAGVIAKHLDACLQRRAVWIMVQMLEQANTKKLLLKDIKKSKVQAKVEALLAQGDGKGDNGLQILSDKLKK